MSTTETGIPTEATQFDADIASARRPRPAWLIVVVIAAGVAMMFGPWEAVMYALVAPAVFLIWDRIETRRPGTRSLVSSPRGREGGRTLERD
jgi:hypothetical protein